jgi:DNA-binding NarL/FixJ family response regulator
MSITVFLADDHAVVRDGLRVLLEAEPDIEVVGDAPDGHEVVELRPDVVVADIAMPGLNGIEAAAQIREACPSTQVIILSMHATSGHIRHALQAGARGYLLKESAGAEVVHAVRAVITGHHYLSQQVADKMVEDYLDQDEASEARDPLTSLTQREREVLQLVAEGKSSAEIAGILSLSPKTVDTYRSRLMEKLDISDLPALVKFAIRHGLISLD